MIPPPPPEHQFQTYAEPAGLATRRVYHRIICEAPLEYAEEAFRCMFAFIRTGKLTVETAPACAGLAELPEDA